MGHLSRTFRQALVRLILGAIGFYQYCVSPYLGARCRFYPTCSQYAKEAFSTFPLFAALKLMLLRILRCHPGCRGGYDPLPSRNNVHKNTML